MSIIRIQLTQTAIPTVMPDSQSQKRMPSQSSSSRKKRMDTSIQTEYVRQAIAECKFLQVVSHMVSIYNYTFYNIFGNKISSDIIVNRVDGICIATNESVKTCIVNADLPLSSPAPNSYYYDIFRRIF